MADTRSRDLSPHLWLAQEEQLRASADPKHAHLSEDLHVEISTFASPAEAHARLALALSEVRAYLIPDSNDQVSVTMMMMIMIIMMIMMNVKVESDGDGDDGDDTRKIILSLVLMKGRIEMGVNGK